jgi:hypothetical protein
MRGDKVGQKPISMEMIDKILLRMLHLPRHWFILSSIFIVLSTFEAALVPGKGFSFTFKVTNTTAVFLALVWLPALLKVFALVGGGVKTPAGEIESPGLGNILQSLNSDTLGFLIDQTAQAEEMAPLEKQSEVRKVRREMQEVYVSKVPANEVREELELLGDQYKEVRRRMESGVNRTYEMSSIVGRMRSLAAQVQFSMEEIKDYLQSEDEGKRLLGTALVPKSSEDINYFEPVLQIIDNPKSAFEQYHALRVMERMAPHLNKTQKQKLHEVLYKQRDYNPAKNQWLERDSDRWIISERILSVIGEQ